MDEHKQTISTGLPKVQQLLQKEVSRKDFMKILGAGALSVVLAHSGLSLLLQNTNTTGTDKPKRRPIYGDSPYGR